MSPDLVPPAASQLHGAGGTDGPCDAPTFNDATGASAASKARGPPCEAGSGFCHELPGEGGRLAGPPAPRPSAPPPWEAAPPVGRQGAWAPVARPSSATDAAWGFTPTFCNDAPPSTGVARRAGARVVFATLQVATEPAACNSWALGGTSAWDSTRVSCSGLPPRVEPPCGARSSDTAPAGLQAALRLPTWDSAQVSRREAPPSTALPRGAHTRDAAPAAPRALLAWSTSPATPSVCSCSGFGGTFASKRCEPDLPRDGFNGPGAGPVPGPDASNGVADGSGAGSGRGGLQTSTVDVCEGVLATRNFGGPAAKPASGAPANGGATFNCGAGAGRRGPLRSPRLSGRASALCSSTTDFCEHGLAPKSSGGPAAQPASGRPANGGATVSCTSTTDPREGGLAPGSSGDPAAAPGSGPPANGAATVRCCAGTGRGAPRPCAPEPCELGLFCNTFKDRRPRSTAGAAGCRDEGGCQDASAANCCESGLPCNSSEASPAWCTPTAAAGGSSTDSDGPQALTKGPSESGLPCNTCGVRSRLPAASATGWWIAGCAWLLSVCVCTSRTDRCESGLPSNTSSARRRLPAAGAACWPRAGCSALQSSVADGCDPTLSRSSAREARPTAAHGAVGCPSTSCDGGGPQSSCGSGSQAAGKLKDHLLPGPRFELCAGAVSGCSGVALCVGTMPAIVDVDERAGLAMSAGCPITPLLCKRPPLAPPAPPPVPSTSPPSSCVAPCPVLLPPPLPPPSAPPPLSSALVRPASSSSSSSSSSSAPPVLSPPSNSSNSSNSSRSSSSSSSPPSGRSSSQLPAAVGSGAPSVPRPLPHTGTRTSECRPGPTSGSLSGSVADPAGLGGCCSAALTRQGERQRPSFFSACSVAASQGGASRRLPAKAPRSQLAAPRDAEAPPALHGLSSPGKHAEERAASTAFSQSPPLSAASPPPTPLPRPYCARECDFRCGCSSLGLAAPTLLFSGVGLAASSAGSGHHAAWPGSCGGADSSTYHSKAAGPR